MPRQFLNSWRKLVFISMAFSKGHFVARQEHPYSNKSKCNFFFFYYVSHLFDVYMILKRVIYDVQRINYYCKFCAAQIKRCTFVRTQKRLDNVVLSFINMVRSILIETVLHFDCEVVIAGSVQSRSVWPQRLHCCRLKQKTEQCLLRVFLFVIILMSIPALRFIKHCISYHWKLHLYYLNAIVSKTCMFEKSVLFLSLWHEGGGGICLKTKQVEGV